MLGYTERQRRDLESVISFDAKFDKTKEYPHEHAEALWIRVIDNALIDATLGVSAQLSIRGVVYKSPRLTYWTVTPLEIIQARQFIKGDDGSLQDICLALGMDYDATKEMLVKRYKECLPHLPEEWQDKNFTKK